MLCCMNIGDLAREGRGYAAGLDQVAADLDAHRQDTLAALETTLATAYAASDIAYQHTADYAEKIRIGVADLLTGGGDDAQYVKQRVDSTADQVAQLPGLQLAAREAIKAARDAIFRLGAATLDAYGSAQFSRTLIEEYTTSRTGTE